MNQPQGPADVLSTEELRAAFRLTPVQRAKFMKAARFLASGTGYDPDELISEAVVRALEGTRSCPRGVDPMAFLYNVMKSLASAARESRKAWPRIASMDSPADEKIVAMVRTPDRSVEDRLIADEDSERRLEALMALFTHDPDALCVLMGDLDEMRAEEIRAACSLDEKAYPTVRKRIRRAIERAFPHGWLS